MYFSHRKLQSQIGQVKEIVKRIWTDATDFEVVDVFWGFRENSGPLCGWHVILRLIDSDETSLEYVSGDFADFEICLSVLHDNYLFDVVE